MGQVGSLHGAALDEIGHSPRNALWSRVQYSLGHSLGVVGEQTGSAELFREASAALRTSLEGRDRLREAPAWALTQLNLGTSLRLYAEKAGDMNAMAEAIVAYRAALSIPLPEEHGEIRTRAQAPLEEVTSPRPAPPPA